MKGDGRLFTTRSIPGVHGEWDPDERVRKLARSRKRYNTEGKRLSKDKGFEIIITKAIQDGKNNCEIIECFFSEYKNEFPNLDDDTVKIQMERMINRVRSSIIKKKRESIQDSDDLVLEIMYLISEGKNEDEIVQILIRIFQMEESDIRNRINEIKFKMEELWKQYSKEFQVYHHTAIDSNLKTVFADNPHYDVLDRSGCKTSISGVNNRKIPSGLNILNKYIRMKKKQMDSDRKSINSGKKQKSSKKEFRNGLIPHEIGGVRTDNGNTPFSGANSKLPNLQKDIGDYII